MIVLDTTVLVYAVGTDHALADRSRACLEAIAAGRISATTTVEVIQEFAHVRAQRRPRSDAAGLARDYSDLFAPLLTVGESELAAGMRLFETVDAIGAFDAVLAAAAIAAGAEALVSADRALAHVPGLPVFDPSSADLASLLNSEA